MNFFKKTFILSLAACATMGLTACWESDTENAAEDVGESVEETAEDAGDSMEDAAEDAGDAVDPEL